MNSKIILLLLFASVIALSCSSCKPEEAKTNPKSESNSSFENLTYEGRITVVGNEPFTKLALKIDEYTVYQLSCSEELTKTLRGSQGVKYKVFVDEIVDISEGKILNISKVEKVKIN